MTCWPHPYTSEKNPRFSRVTARYRCILVSASEGERKERQWSTTTR
nr:MAG TPA: hypothetical protein [Caudoviricetes sp.]